MINPNKKVVKKYDCAWCGHDEHERGKCQAFNCKCGQLIKPAKVVIGSITDFSSNADMKLKKAA